MNISTVFPSKYIKAADLDGKEWPLTMVEVSVEKVNDTDEPVLYFNGTRKGLVLNKTNAGRVSDMYGDETTAWRGQRIVLLATTCEFGGKTVPCIRVKPGDNGQPGQPVVVPEPAHAAVPDSDIPF